MISKCIIRVVLYTCVLYLSGVLCTTDNFPNSSKNPNQASIIYPYTVTYTCAAGYKLSDGSSFVTRSCQIDGSLSGTTPACSGKFDLIVLIFTLDFYYYICIFHMTSLLSWITSRQKLCYDHTIHNTFCENE